MAYFFYFCSFLLLFGISSRTMHRFDRPWSWRGKINKQRRCARKSAVLNCSGAFFPLFHCEKERLSVPGIRRLFGCFFFLVGSTFSGYVQQETLQPTGKKLHVTSRMSSTRKSPRKRSRTARDHKPQFTVNGSGPDNANQHHNIVPQAIFQVIMELYIQVTDPSTILQVASLLETLSVVVILWSKKLLLPPHDAMNFPLLSSTYCRRWPSKLVPFGQSPDQPSYTTWWAEGFQWIEKGSKVKEGDKKSVTG